MDELVLGQSNIIHLSHFRPFSSLRHSCLSGRLQLELVCVLHCLVCVTGTTSQPPALLTQQGGRMSCWERQISCVSCQLWQYRSIPVFHMNRQTGILLCSWDLTRCVGTDLHVATPGAHPGENPRAISACDIHAFWAMVQAAGYFFHLLFYTQYFQEGVYSKNLELLWR